MGDSVLYRWGEVAKVTEVLTRGQLEVQSPEAGQFCPRGLCKVRAAEVKATTACIGPHGELACDTVANFLYNEAEFVGRPAMLALNRSRPRAARLENYPEWHGCFGSSAACRRGVRRECCSGRGRCVMGWCECDHGASGLDCAHGAPAAPDAPGAPDAPRGGGRGRGVAIYVYELPSELGLARLSRMWWEGAAPTDVFSAEWRFLDLLLRDVCCAPEPRTPE